MYENALKDRCPICNSGSFNYYVNGYGTLTKRCAGCGHFITTKSAATDKTAITEYTQLTNTNVLPHNYSEDYIKANDIDASKIKPYEIDQTKLNTIELKCKTITLKQGEVEITFDLDMQLKDYEFITINGVKFKRVEEE